MKGKRLSNQVGMQRQTAVNDFIGTERCRIKTEMADHCGVKCLKHFAAQAPSSTSVECRSVQEHITDNFSRLAIKGSTTSLLLLIRNFLLNHIPVVIAFPASEALVAGLSSFIVPQCVFGQFHTLIMTTVGYKMNYCSDCNI